MPHEMVTGRLAGPTDFHAVDLGFAVNVDLRCDKLAGQHPCPRPVDVLEAIIENYTTPESLILDPTVGSGSVCVAVARLRRQYVGIEISEGYAALARKRIEVEAK